MQRRFLNTAQLAEYLGVSQSAIRSWVKYGKIPYSKLGKAVRFDMIKIGKWLHSKEIQEFKGYRLQ